MKDPELAACGNGGLVSLSFRPTFDLMVRSERLAAAAAIFRMSGLLLDFMISIAEVYSLEYNEDKDFAITLIF